MEHSKWILVLFLSLWGSGFGAFGSGGPAEPFLEHAAVAFDFTRAAACSEWEAAHHVAALRSTAEGLEISINGNDPYIHGPVRDYPAGVPLRLAMRIKSDTGGSGQIFYFRDAAREEDSARFSVKVGEWIDVRAMLPPLGPGYRLRIDPPGESGTALIAFLGFEPAPSLAAPKWLPHEPADFADAVRIGSGPVDFRVGERGWSLAVDGQRVASSHTRPMIGYVLGGQVRWLDAGPPARVRRSQRGVESQSALRDPDGAAWRVTRTYCAGARPGVIDVEVIVETSQDREAAFLPLILMAVFEGSPHKGQALLPGLEYLENEPSSSEADLIGPESNRRVPASHKLTFPLMAMQKDGRYIGLVWEHREPLSVLFDSPDRLLGTGGHLMGVLFPGCDGFNRREGDLMPIRTEALRAGRKLAFRGQIVGGRGGSVVPAIQQYVSLRGLPAIPPGGCTFDEYVRLAAHGWLDSKIRATNFFRHAVFGDRFPAGPSADAALYLRWLGTHATDPALGERLAEASRGALSAVPPGQLESALVGHVRYPVQSLVFGGVSGAVEHHRRHARGLLERFRPDGTIPYRAMSDGPDYGRTHFADHANGLTAQVLMTALEAAMFAGDPALIDDALARLGQVRRAYANGVPRGAQTWEVPLHTPDIMASAHMVRAFTMGYQLTGEREWLEEAIYWAWAGLPFLYLVPPVGTADLPYGCVTVFGATAWKSPVWIGRPVQWCGLVYADALYRLVPWDPSGPWKQIADGITATGIRYSWPLDDPERQGLLPDGWELLTQDRNGPPINPGTVQASAVRLFSRGPIYDCRVWHTGRGRIIAHAPGAILADTADSRRLKFTVRAWSKEPYYVLVNGWMGPVRLEIGGRPAPLGEPHLYQAEEGRLVLKLSGHPVIEIEPGSL
ncbi:MAG TPA: hypothetical protein P5022_00030 [Candidatus Paceibacterota bacterium]|nr:hypothetical protein [Candidatus Paceibacterota bacterium]